MNKRRLLTLVTSAAMSLGAMSTAAYAANFADINNVPWEGAKTYINAVADAGLMVGDYNDLGQKVFRANDGVTYCETMQLAYALMKDYTGKAVDSSVVTKYKSVMSGYKIPDWAHEAVAYGLENKIVTISEIPAFVNSSGASVNATRQDVAIIFGRALSQIESTNSNPNLTFKDASSITAVAKPYVELLNRLGIITGDDLGNFNPKNSINRAEMAVIVSKTNDYLDDKVDESQSSQVQTGTISGEITNLVNVGNNTTIVVTSGSTNMQFTGNSTTGCLDANGSRVLISQLSVGDNVLVSYKGDEIVSILVTEEEGSSSSSTSSKYDVEGTFVSLGSYTIKLKVDGDEKSYELYDKDDTYFSYDGSVKSYDKFKDLVSEGDKIGLVLDRNDWVTYVYAIPGESDYDEEGYYDDISSSYIKIKSSKSASAKKYSFEDDDSDNVKFYKSKSGSSVSYSSFKDYVNENDKIGIITNSHDEVTKVYIIERADDDEDYDEEGYFYSISSSRIRIKPTKSGDYDSYYFEDKDSDNVKFYKSKNGSSVDYDEFEKYVEEDDKIGLITNSDDEVTKVYILSSSSSSDSTDGELYSISSSKLKLKGDSQSYIIDDKDKIDVDVDDGDETIDDFDDLVEAFNDDYKYFQLTIKYDDDYYVTEITGYITSIERAVVYGVDRDKETITIKTDSGTRFTYDVDSDCDYSCGSDYSDSLRGVEDAYDEESEVEIEMEFNKNGKVTDITLDY